MDDFERTLSGRLTALARGHDLLLRSEWQSTSLANVLERSLFPFLTQGQATLDSGDVRLTPRAALAFNLILHELATNASKYGALSVPEGRLDVRCEKRAGDAKTAEFIWVERGGPPVNPPRRQGFGSKLIERCARYELTGEVQLAYEPAGFKCEIRFPLGG